METLPLLVSQIPYLMFMVHRCSPGDLTPPFYHLSTAHITQALLQVSILDCCGT